MKSSKIITNIYAWIALGILIGLAGGLGLSGVIEICVKEMYKTHTFWYIITALVFMGIGIGLGNDNRY